MAGTDIEDRRVPRRAIRLTVVAATIAFLLDGVLNRQWEPSQRAAIAALLVAGVTGPLWWLAPGGFAFGDVKVSVLAGAGAAAASWPALAATFFLACVIGSLLGLVVLVHRARSVKAGPAALTIPFVPGLTVGFILAVSMC